MYMHVQGMLLLLASGHVYGRLCALLTLDECHVVSWSDKCTYDNVLYRMVRLLFTLPARKDMDQLLNYYFKQNTQMSTSVRYRTQIQLPTLIATGSIHVHVHVCIYSMDVYKTVAQCTCVHVCVTACTLHVHPSLPVHVYKCVFTIDYSA